MHYKNLSETRGVLAALRSVVPTRDVTYPEAMRVAELQANRLLAIFDITDGAVPSEIVSELPRVRVVRDDLPVSGTSHWSGTHWSGTHWIITLNQRDNWRRQRFTLMHEFKHIIDHGRAHLLYTGDNRHTPAEQAELIADYFAGCVLMPKRLLKAAWGHGIQRSAELARTFSVSAMAVEVRLSQTGLNVVRDRCFPPLVGRFARGRRPLYQRQLATQGLCS